MLVIAVVFASLGLALSFCSAYWMWLAGRFREGHPPMRYWLPRSWKELLQFRDSP